MKKVIGSILLLTVLSVLMLPMAADMGVFATLGFIAFVAGLVAMAAYGIYLLVD